MKAPTIRLRKVADMRRDPENARTHSPEQLDQIKASIRRFGYTSPVLEDEFIRAGNGRHEAVEQMYAEGETLFLAPGADRGGAPLPPGTIPAIDCTGWSPEERQAYALADNQLAMNADWDEERLADQLRNLMAADFEIPIIGFDDMELNRLLGDEEGRTDPNEVLEPPANPVTREGDLWLLGEAGHRLLCGSSTDADCVARLLGDDQPVLMVTDPPYGVNYDPDWRNKANWTVGPVSYARSIGKVQNDDRADWSEAWALFPGPVAYVWHGGLHVGEVQASLEKAGFEMRAQIIWAKQQFVIGRGAFHWQHEPCQPAGTLVAKVEKSGITKVPIESLKAGDRVVSFGNAKIYRRGREITRIGSRNYSGNLHTIRVGQSSTRATAEHQFSIRFDPAKPKAGLLYLMRRGDRYRIGVCGLFNSRGFGLAVRLSQERGEEAWIVGAFPDLGSARIAEQVACCQYGIPTTHWETDRQVGHWSYRDKEGIETIYRQLGVGRIAKGVARLMADYGLSSKLPLITADEVGRFSRKQSRVVRACNLVPGIMQIPVPTTGERFEWRPIAEATFKAVKNQRVWSMDVDGDHHYVADGLVTHNCWYAVRKGQRANWVGGRKQSTIWEIDNLGSFGRKGGRKTDGSDDHTGHGTQKPLECMRRPIENNSRPGQFIYDPFSGSFTTGIACEMTRRCCLALDLDPSYCDVAVLRWQRFTGQAARLESGQTFAEVAAERGVELVVVPVEPALPSIAEQVPAPAL